jgi:hypothetical protein
MSNNEAERPPLTPDSPQPPNGLAPASTPPRPGIPPHQRRRSKKLRILLTVTAAFAGSMVAYSLFGHELSSGRDNATIDSSRSTTPPPGETETLSALDLRPGDCYIPQELPPPDGSAVPISTVELVNCQAAHNAQIVAHIHYKVTDNYRDVLDNRAGPACQQEFQQKVQPALLDNKQYSLTILAPLDDESWRKRPSITCVVLSDPPAAGTALQSEQ